MEVACNFLQATSSSKTNCATDPDKNIEKPYMHRTKKFQRFFNIRTQKAITLNITKDISGVDALCSKKQIINKYI